MVKHWSLRYKLWCSFGILILFLMGSGAGNYYAFLKFQALSQTQTERAEDQHTAAEFKNLIGVLYSYQADLIINEDPQTIEGYKEQKASFEKHIALLEESMDTGEEKAWVQELKVNADAYTANFNSLVDLFNKRASLPDNELKSAYKALDDNTDEHKAKLYKLIDLISASYGEEYDEASVALKLTLSSIMSLTIIGVPLMVLAAALLSILLTRALVRPIRRLAEVTERIAQGDLTVVVKPESRDEVGALAASFEAMVYSLKRLIREVGENSSQVAAASEQLTASAEQTSSATEHIAEIMQELAGQTERQAASAGASKLGVDEMSQQVRRMAEDTSGVVAEANSAEARTAAGLGAIHSAVQGMDAVSDQISRTNGIIDSLAARSEEITEMNRVIRAVATQTNMLALNAGIEAARAGEHGQGFAVVATEIRKLAEQCSVSSDGVDRLIAAVKDETGRAVAAMSEVREVLGGGMSAVRAAGESFSGIEGSIREVGSRIRSVDGAIQDIAKHASGMVTAIDEMRLATETSASAAHGVSAASEEQLASMQEIASSSAHLSSMADELGRMLRQFKTE
ncbi:MULTISPECIES: methyl-accepting chemotaxis protein [Paenibacillus]|uniref:methyl-accepting chemotaxis protein n=1 Tax=Paenibacillus TaxID=44249 RepID=UPI0022B8DB43|nr:methyl-accepting chemotaxis protein [Paenibacillus caseinilyticus]MCZ8518687.1 methyl-accepting chemotaxis protein [Paenibacillus caseinilyticus]